MTIQLLPMVPRTQPLSADAPAPRGNRPPWLKVRFPQGPNYQELRLLMREQNLHTICEEALCPNIGECWENRTATFLILGDVCTRNCGFCNVTTGRPTGLDLNEPERLARAVQQIGLRHIVITSVTRDDLPDGGSAIFAATIRKLREYVPGCGVEVLIPDFRGNWDALATVMDARPDILNHNMETVPRLYRRVRPKAIYEQSLELLRRAKELQ
jgi:lipoyl synthase